ncbi:MAG: glutathione S-transferase family protein [Pseudomonadota bacterium]
MLTLYHFNEATCGVKVRLVLAEKEIDFEERALNRNELRTPEYLKLNPDGVVPTLVVHGGAEDVVLRESSVIMVYLDDAYPAPPLRPDDPLPRANIHWWMKRIDDVFFPALGAVTYATIIRTMQMPIDEEQLKAQLASVVNVDKRHQRWDVMVNGLESKAVQYAVGVLARMVDEVDQTLSSQAYLSGGAYGLADAAITPFLLRAEWFGLMDHPKRDYSLVRTYWQQITSRPSYQTVVGSRMPPEAIQGFLAALAPHKARIAEIRDAAD